MKKNILLISLIAIFGITGLASADVSCTLNGYTQGTLPENYEIYNEDTASYSCTGLVDPEICGEGTDPCGYMALSLTDDDTLYEFYSASAFSSSLSFSAPFSPVTGPALALVVVVSSIPIVDLEDVDGDVIPLSNIGPFAILSGTSEEDPFATAITDTFGSVGEQISYLFTENLPTIGLIAAAMLGLILVWGWIKRSARR